MNFKTRPELGTKVTIHCKLKRNIEYKIETRPKVNWEPIEIPPTTGYYIGFRIKQNGILQYGGFDEPGYLQLTSTITCALIILNERANPIHVPFDGIEIAPTAKENQ